MSAPKGSKQRDAIMNELLSRFDHPTAEELYMSLKKDIPNISLATVYRNLKILEQEKLILKISTGESDRYDGHCHKHYHFTCNSCKRVLDLELRADVDVDALPVNFDGKVSSHSLMYFGLCPDCIKK